ncbi:MAG: hypothetical protein LBR08_11090 [Bacteroidales bacterium]|jgi:hypothetical protein|nr:hypothetical protein [Bacteroidales bacterium]
MNYRDKLTTHIEFSDSRKEVVLADKGHSDIRYVAHNPAGRTVCVFRVDGGLICDNEPKCDRLMVAESKHSVQHPDFYFVELKGKDFETAIRQLTRSVDLLICRIDYHSVHCRLVMSKCPTPDIGSSNRIKLERKLKSMNGNFKRQSRQLEETI